MQRTGLERVEGRLVGQENLGGADRPDMPRDLSVGNAGNLEVTTHANVGRVLCRGEITEGETHDGGVMVSLDEGGDDARG